MWSTLLSAAMKYGPTIASAAGSMAAGKSAGRAQTNVHNANADQMGLQAQGQEENSAQNRAKLEMDQKEAQREGSMGAVTGVLVLAAVFVMVFKPGA